MALSGLRVVEFAGLAPGPFAGLILADRGASVTRIDQPSSTSSDILCRGKRSFAINPKVPSGLEVLKKLVAKADVLIDPFRPGVLERLGLGPQVFLGSDSDKRKRGINEKLIYARIAGFPTKGSYKNMAGHDINYLALSGVLSMLPCAPDKPSFPLNLLADFAGGGLMCALGIMLALIERGKSGRGQIVEADMVSGSRYLSSFPLLHALSPSSQLFTGVKLLAGGAPFYDVYACKGGGFVSVGCIEPQFFKAFIERFVREVNGDRDQSEWTPSPKMQMDFADWPRMRQYLTDGFKTQERNYWGTLFHGTDACVVPVLSPTEASSLDISKSPLPVPHPHLTRTLPQPSAFFPHSSTAVKESLYLRTGQHTDDVLRELGVNDEERLGLIKDGALETTVEAKL